MVWRSWADPSSCVAHAQLKGIRVNEQLDVDASNLSQESCRHDGLGRLFTVPTVTGRILFVFVVLLHHRRRIVHFNVTEHPTAAWTAQQLVEAFPDDSAPRWVLHRG